MRWKGHGRFVLALGTLSLLSLQRARLAFSVMSSSEGFLEVEQKFHCSAPLLSSLEASAELSDEARFTDVYWDTSDFRLTTRDLWLRQRDGALELKAREDGAKALDGDFVSVYRELTELPRIAERLQTLDLSLPAPRGAGPGGPGDLDVFARIETWRRRYKATMPMPDTGTSFAVFIDIDRVSFPREGDERDERLDGGRVPRVEADYVIGEVELDASGAVSELSTAQKLQLLQHALTRLEIASEPVPGKVEEFLRRYRIKHFEALKTAGVL